MIFKLKQLVRYILKRLLFEDECIICNKILRVKENAFCGKCLENLKSISSLKKQKNVYYLWILNEIFIKVLGASKNRMILAEDLREIIVEKIIFILRNEKVSTLNYKNSEFFTALFNKEVLEEFSNYINSENRQNLIFREHLNQTIESSDIYFSLFINIKLLEI